MSFSSNISTDSFKKMKVNLNDKFSGKLKEILENYDKNSNVILFADSNNSVWEIIKRKDLTIYSLLKPELINSISKRNLEEENIYLQIETKKIDNESLNNSQVEIMNNSDFNICDLMEDTQNELTEF